MIRAITSFTHSPSVDCQSLRRAIYGLLDWDYRAKSIPPAVLPMMNACGMVYSRSKAYRCNGHVTGVTHNAMAFSVLEIAAREDAISYYTDNQNTQPSWGFKGLIITLNHFEKFHGRTIVVTDKGHLNPPIINGMKRVGVADIEFEHAFEIYGDDQVEARALVSLDFMGRLLQFQTEMQADVVECVFLSHQLHIVLNIGDRFRFGRDIQSPHISSAAQQILSEIGGLFSMLEHAQFLHARLGWSGARAQDKARREYYDAKMVQLKIDIARKLEEGGLGREKNPHLTDTAHMICPSLHGLLSPRF